MHSEYQYQKSELPYHESWTKPDVSVTEALKSFKEMQNNPQIQTKNVWHLFNLARIGIVQNKDQGRVCPFLVSAWDELSDSLREKVSVINSFYESEKGIISEANKPYIDILPTLKFFPKGSLGYLLGEFYEQRSFPKLGALGSFPAEYILRHDAHHGLLGVDTDEQGEIEVCAFEGGLSGGTTAQSILPLLAQVQAFGIPYNIHRVARAWEIGCNALPGLLESWDILNDLHLTIPQIREKYRIGTM